MRVNRFTIDIGQDDIDDLRQRLFRPRWPQSVVPAGWDDGSSLTFMQELVRYWQYEFDWRAQEQRLNRLPHFIGEIDGFKIHYIHVSGRGPSPIPLVMTHGWPGSFLAMERVIPLLTDPGAFGGDPEDAFDLVVPSLPGYTFSSSPATACIGPFEIAGLWQKLMTGLGYEKFGAQGGDIGAAISGRRYRAGSAFDSPRMFSVST